MNNFQRSATSLARTLFNAVVVIALVGMASLIGVGGAALWIYSRPVASAGTGVAATAEARPTGSADGERVLPKLAALDFGSESPRQLTPARYVPSESEIATVSDSPRYTYISYNGGRQQAHLKVHTVLATSIPAPLDPGLAADDNAVTPAPVNGGSFLSDPSSRYIINSQGRVVGIDGTGATAPESAPDRAAVNVMPPEVRVASPVAVRRATPVDDDENIAQPAEGGFNVQSELAREDDRPALRALPVTHASRPARSSMFGAGDDFGTDRR